MIFNSFSPPLASTAKDVSHTSGAEAVVEGRKADVDKTVEEVQELDTLNRNDL